MTRLLTIAVLMAIGYIAGCSTARAAGMRLAWNANDPAEQVLVYELVLEEVWGFGIHAVETSETTAAIDGLKPATAYFAKVRARNSIGWGEFSAVITGTTPAPMIRLTIQRSDDLLIWTDTETFLEVERKDAEFFRIKIEPQ
jgi:hypothetical protein